MQWNIVHDFANDSNLINFNKSIKVVKEMNHDLKSMIF